LCGRRSQPEAITARANSPARALPGKGARRKHHAGRATCR
jgi:hypothetical protein